MLVAIDTETTGLNPFVHDILVAAFEHFDIPVDGRHTALGDAIATRKLYERILLQF